MVQSGKISKSQMKLAIQTLSIITFFNWSFINFSCFFKVTVSKYLFF